MSDRSEIFETGNYFRRLNDTLIKHQQMVSKNPPREVELLRAMKAFIPPERHESTDRLIDAMMLTRTMASIQSEQRKRRMAASDASVHPDGVYDVDDTCIAAGRNEMNGFLLMALVAMAQM